MFCRLFQARTRSLVALALLLLLSSTITTTVRAVNVVRVRYGYFPEARPIHAGCARGWFDLWLNNGDDTYYQVECYPQTSGNFAASRLDNLQLDLAHLGSTPLAQAIARGVDLKVVYISQYQGDSQGIYVRPSEPERDYIGIEHPFDLAGRTVGVPFGSTVHYQLLFLIDLIGLSGSVSILDMSPTQIMEAWNDPKRDPPIIDAAGCWGAAREFVLGQQAETLITARVMADWGRPTFVDVAATRTYAEAHPEFMKHIVGVLSRINDSFLDRLGKYDPYNVDRWDPLEPAGVSLVPSMVDALMVAGEMPQNPTDALVVEQRLNLDLFVQLTAAEQTSCEYLGPRPNVCDQPTSQHLDTRQTGEFLVGQKILAHLGPLEIAGGGDGGSCPLSRTLCGSDIFDGTYLEESRAICSNCLPLGPYNNGSTPLVDSSSPESTDELLRALEEMDTSVGRSPFAIDEVGRAAAGQTSTGDSTCVSGPVIFADAQVGQFGDGANAENGLGYSDGKSCRWVVKGSDCNNPEASCDALVELKFDKMRLWSGDYVRVFTDPGNNCETNATVLLAQVSGIDREADLPPLRTRGCLLVELETDGNEERLYSGYRGDGFVASFDRNAPGCSYWDDCNGQPCDDGLCECKNSLWGADCSLAKSCLGTKHVELETDGEPKIIKSSFSINPSSFSDSGKWSEVVPPSEAYPNDLDCRFDIVADSSYSLIHVEILYDLEPTYDMLWLHSGSLESSPLLALTGSHIRPTGENYYLPTDGAGTATIRFTTDGRGRRRGFHATLRAVGNSPGIFTCSTPGYSGSLCEVPHCISKNNKIDPLQTEWGSYNLGRVVSQSQDWPQPGMSSVPAMPWAPDVGCTWEVFPKEFDPNAIGTAEMASIRLVFHNSGLDLEAHPASDVGDKLIVAMEGKEHTFFVESCQSDEACSFPWQTGSCVNGGCAVKSSLEIPVEDKSNLEGSRVSLVTDRNDNGGVYRGLDFDILLVAKCPTEEGLIHCEAVEDGMCVDGFCYCSGNVPCDCPCDGDAPLVSSSGVNIGMLVGIIAPIFLLLAIAFLWYRRRQIRKYHEKKRIIEVKEAELQAFRDSIVGMRSAITTYVPTIAADAPPEAAAAPPAAPVEPLEQVVWCWKETDGFMHLHGSNDTYGDPKDCWIKYDENAKDLLEAAFNTGKKMCSPNSGYVVDFTRMIQKKVATGFERDVFRVVEKAQPSSPPPIPLDVDLTDVEVGTDRIPAELRDEPQMIVVCGDVIQISKQSEDGWAFGSKLHLADDGLARTLMQKATHGSRDDMEVCTDTGWFPLDTTRVPSGEDLAVLQSSVGDSSALNPPSHWDPVADPTVVERHVLDLQSPEATQVVQAFMSTLTDSKYRHLKVKQVERIQNLAMWQTYVVKRQTICYRETGVQSTDIDDEDSPSARAIQRFERCWLWHATEGSVIDKILQQGFNRSFCGKNATAYGKGVYFARDASYSAYKLYAVPDSTGTQYMMACRVVVGEYCQGRFDALTPDVRDVQNNILYDSTVGLLSGDTMDSPSIYVTYHDAQAYPEYLISFKT